MVLLKHKNLFKISVAFFVCLIGVAQVKAATEEEIEAAIEKGLDWLAAVQNPDGSWSGIGCDACDVDECWYWCECDKVSKTGLVVLKFETRAHELGLDPLDQAYEYSSQVASGLDYIIGNANEIAIGPQPAGDPDGNGNGKGVYFTDCGHETYDTGIAMMALAASGHPELYQTILQDALDYIAWGQVEAGCGVDPCCPGVHRGGWGYMHNTCEWSDNSNSGYATLGLGYAATGPPYGFSLTIPQFVLDELNIWLGVMQDPVNGDMNDGGSIYNPCWLGSDWVNILKTGNLIYQMALVGDTNDTQRVKDAIDYIERHWNDPCGCEPGWMGHRQAMFTMMKGLEVFNIETIVVDGNEIDWFDEVSTHLVETQDPCGFWGCDCWGNKILSTAWAVLTLEKAVPKLAMEVAIDIKPRSCPNPLNVKSKGVLPVAILGTAELDVTTIDIATILLEGVVSPIRSSYEDVATPVSDGEECECTTRGPDGFTDLSLKFAIQEIVAVIGEVNHGDELQLVLTGALLEEFNGTPIVGADCVVIRGKHKPLNAADLNKNGVVDAADLAIVAQNWLQSNVVEG